MILSELTALRFASVGWQLFEGWLRVGREASFMFYFIIDSLISIILNAIPTHTMPV